MIRMVVPQLHRLSEELPKALYSQQSKARLARFLWLWLCLPRARQPLWGRANLELLVEMEKERVSEGKLALVTEASRCIVTPNERMVNRCMGSAAAGPSRRGDAAGISKLRARVVFNRNRLGAYPRNSVHEILFGGYQPEGDEIILQETIHSKVLSKASLP